MNLASINAENGMALVISHQTREWRDQAAEFLLDYLKVNGPATLDQARAYAQEIGLDNPTHPNAWGALTRTMHKRGDIVRTGEWRQSERPESHARMAPVWRAAW